MMLTEYNEEETMQMFKEEYLEQGRSEGLEQGRAIGESIGLAKSVDALVANTDWPLEQACKALNFSIEEYNSAKKAGIL